MTLDSVRRAYDALAEDYAALLPDTRAESALDLAVLDAFAREVAGPVLDAGCGAGRMSRYLADRGCRVHGVDLSPGMVERARRDHPDLTFDVAALTDLPFADATFGGIVLWYSTIHTPPAGQPEVLAEVRRVLRPGGSVVVAFQAGTGSRDLAPAYRRVGHDVVLERHLFAPDDVAAWLAGAGLRETCRLVRRPQGREADDQAVLLTRAEG
ncbi:class I SAM-dependent methyltransferase [Georgenia wutianyii]|uniref:Class I SAM-dependent methyltransferase n=1 Tax=Georgenia wutianyii TaxID=2585135 RepID=A0ABX5VKB6_9MICO|nr:class I SAM-dependent methyltransferase [Georgenia wutianyii]QDB78887.1 class I SAM-dependent methyltransferase [Georgenia wutianyii]